MKVYKVEDIEAKENSASLFTAPVTMQAVETVKENSPGLVYVSFPKGVRNKFHTHNNDQILVVTEGKGWIVTDSARQEITVGDVVVIPAGEKHWHGATDNSSMTHIAISAPGTSIEQIEQ